MTLAIATPVTMDELLLMAEDLRSRINALEAQREAEAQQEETDE